MNTNLVSQMNNLLPEIHIQIIAINNLKHPN